MLAAHRRTGPLRRPFPNRARTGIAFLLVGAMVLTGLSLLPGVRTPGSNASTTGISSGGGPVVIAPAFIPPPGVRALGPLPANTSIEVAVALAPRDPAGLAAATVLEYTPGTPEYHHFLSAPEIANQYGPPAQSYRAAAAYFAGSGLRVQGSPDGMMLLLQGSPTEVGAAFHTTFDSYRAGALEFFNHPTSATLPALAPWLGAYGLGNDSLATPDVRSSLSSPVPLTPTPSASCPATVPYAPCTIQKAYNATPALTAGENGTGYRFAVVDTYDGTENQTTLESDLSAFTENFGIPLGTVHYLYPVPTTHNLNLTSTGWGTEEALDLEWSRAMAPGATIDMTLAPDPGAGLYGSVDWLVAHQAANVISLSWGEPDVGVYNSFSAPCSSACNATSDGSYEILHPVLVDAAAEGIGVFSASGDCGAAEGTNGVSTGYPASDPWVTGVGATDLSLSNGSYKSETAWSGNASGASDPGCVNQGGSGGGYSPFARPWWQVDQGVPSKPDVRGVPDVAIDGGTDVSIAKDGFLESVGGTSASSVFWAGLATDADAAVHTPLGFLNPILYAIARSSAGSSTFHDVTTGSNGYSAGVGWDPVTGIGSPNVGRLFPRLTANQPPPGTLALSLGANPRFGAAPLNVTFDLAPTGGAPPYPLLDVDFGDGNSSLASSDGVTHAYPSPGVYVATATVFDSVGNSSTSAPVAIVVGGGRALTVSLNVSNAVPAVSQQITLTANVSGGSAPYQYYFSFGDGTYLANTTSAAIAHSYGAEGGYCATVVARDAGRPTDGGLSERVAIGVGGAARPNCSNGQTLTARVASNRTIADLPGDLNLTVTPVGGTPPYSIQWVSDDPYAQACGCGLFRVVGPHSLTAFVNDSVDEETTVRLNVTLFPALVGSFGHSALAGPAPFTAMFTAAASGGDDPQANQTVWTFGDGTTVSGASVSHQYSTPGQYTVIGKLGDAAGGVTSAAFLVDVLAPSAPAGPALTLVVSPAVSVPAGTLVELSANVTGASGPFTYRWDLGDDDGAFGQTVTQTFGDLACLRDDLCPLIIGVRATTAAGNATSAVLVLPNAVDGRATAIALSDNITPLSGATPLHIAGTANASGLPGLAVGWDFGDGTNATGATTSHTYRTAGNYTVTDSATDVWGDRLLRSQAVVVSGPERAAPSLTGGPNVTSGFAPLFVNFSVAGTGGGGAPYAFAWNFGDGSVGSGGSPVHEYVDPGRYLATVTVSDALLNTNESIFSVTVYNRTTVTMALSLAQGNVLPGGTVGTTLSAFPECTNLSAPGCSISQFQVQFGFVPQSGGPLREAGSASPGPTGGIFIPLTAPSTPDAYWLRATVVGANYTGTVQAPLVVQSPVSPVVVPYFLDPVWILLAGAGGGALALLGGLAIRRPPDEPSP